MRISDWSSYVCSSDLYCLKPRSETAIDYPSRHSRPPQASLFRSTGHCEWPHPIAANGLIAGACLSYARTTKSTSIKVPNGTPRLPSLHVTVSWTPSGQTVEYRSSAVRQPARSDEHTSELQSLLRNSYAAYCLKQQTV